MDETFSTKAIILNRQPWRENDLMVSLYSPERGRLDLVARGARKSGSKLAGHVEPISLSKIMVVRGKKIDYLGSAINENCYLNIKNDLLKLAFAGKALNFFIKIIKPLEADIKIFFLLKNFLERLNNVEKLKHGLWKEFFILKILSESGYKTEFYQCVKCLKKIEPGKNYFGLKRGGLLCEICSTGEKDIPEISDDAIKILRYALLNDFGELNKLKIDKELEREIRDIVESFYQYNLNLE